MCICLRPRNRWHILPSFADRATSAVARRRSQPGKCDSAPGCAQNRSLPPALVLITGAAGFTLNPSAANAAGTHTCGDWASHLPTSGLAFPTGYPQRIATYPQVGDNFPPRKHRLSGGRFSGEPFCDRMCNAGLYESMGCARHAPCGTERNRRRTINTRQRPGAARLSGTSLRIAFNACLPLCHHTPLLIGELGVREQLRTALPGA